MLGRRSGRARRNNLHARGAESDDGTRRVGAARRHVRVGSPTSTKGGSAGKLGPFVGSVKQVMDLSSGDGPSYYNEVKLRGVRAQLDAHWETLDPQRWKVIFDTLSVYVLGKRVVEKPFPPGQTGIWRMTYLDDKMRVLRASGSNTPETENVYVLAKASS